MRDFTLFALIFTILIAISPDARAQEAADRDPGTADQTGSEPVADASDLDNDQPVDRDSSSDTPEMDAIVQSYLKGDYVTARTGLAKLAPDGSAHAKYRYGRILYEGLGGPRLPAEAAQWLKEAVDEDHIAAATLLAQLFLHGDGVAQDSASAVALLERAATRGDAPAQYQLGMILRAGQIAPRNLEQSFNWLLAAAEQQRPDAGLALSEAFFNGLGTQKDDAKGLSWLERAAGDGSAQAQLALASRLEAGAGVPADPAGALEWYRRASENGLAIAQRVLGTKYLLGDGVDQNTDEGIRWLKHAAKGGDAGAMSNLGYAYSTGTGVTPDDATAFGWYLEAADRGLIRAMLVVARFYEDGRGVEKNLNRAVESYRAALAGGEAQAAVRLGSMAAQGQLDEMFAPQISAPWVLAAAREGDAAAEAWLKQQSDNGVVPAKTGLAQLLASRDGMGQIALGLLTEAAMQGDPVAQFRLGEMYLNGANVTQDYVTAHKWFNIAATHGLTNAANRRAIVSDLMTPEQIADAQQQARVFFAEVDAARVPTTQPPSPDKP